LITGASLAQFFGIVLMQEKWPGCNYDKMNGSNLSSLNQHNQNPNNAKPKREIMMCLKNKMWLQILKKWNRNTYPEIWLNFPCVLLVMWKLN
jgi:hypothetical protein